MKEFKKFILIVAVFAGCFYLPIEKFNFKGPLFEAFALVNWYAREHVLLCLVPAFFIAGAIAIFINKAAIVKYFGAKANKFLAYGVASISGTILSVCSCTVLPLFAGIYKKGAGIGPATAFLYSGPAINILAIIMTARILGWELGIARAIGAIAFSIIVGLLMHLIFIKEERERLAEEELSFWEDNSSRPVWQNTVCLAAVFGILLFASWKSPQASGDKMVNSIASMQWYMIALFLAIFTSVVLTWFENDELKNWGKASWGFAKQIMPLLLLGVFVAGLLLGRPDQEGLIPSAIIKKLVGGNSLGANFFASIVGAFMYFATLTEVPILQGLLGAGMGKGPALALLLAGPALSLPNMLVIRSVIGTKKTIVYVSLVVIMATISGILFGSFIK
ncbi:MAG: permease [Candidatus Omnitrophota bacterium]